MNQERLQNSHVMVVGCGALGNEVMKNLVLMGIGHLVIVDFDYVEQGNLTRSVLYRSRDVGRKKVEAAREALLDIRPNLDVKAIFGDITYDVGLGLIQQMDVIVGCVDSRWARYCIQRLALRANKTWVDGGILGLEGTARVFRPGQSCYACSLNTETLQDMHRRISCAGVIRRAEQAGHAPTTPLIASIIGAVETQEAIKVLGESSSASADKNSQHPNRMFYYEGESMTVHTPIFEAWDDACALHDETWLSEEGRTIERKSKIAEFLTEYPGSTLILSDPFVDYVVDRVTDEHTEVMLPAHRVERFMTTHPTLSGRLLCEFYQHEFHEVDNTFPYPQLTLADLGIPPTDIVRIKTENKIRYIKTT